MDSSSREVTQLLARLSAGDQSASAKLIALVYPELRSMARRCMRNERPGHTLQATGLVHEAYLRLIGLDRIQWQNRAHFFGIAARVMRQVLLDYAREHHARKRGGGAARVDLDDNLLIAEDHLDDVMAMDESLDRLAEVDPDQARLIELRFFAGMTVDEIAEVMAISTATVKREWSHAKAWLRRDMSQRSVAASGNG